jgi:hypothetical protein
MGSRKAIASVLTVAAIAAGGTPAAPGEQHAVPASASWQARVRIFVTGPQQAFLLGAFGGRLAVEKEPRTLDGAQLVCPTAVDADYAAGTQRAEGRCVITTGGGDRLFARWMCVGEPEKGCAGRFVLTGGTGAFQGVTGESAFVLRLLLSEIIQFDRQEAEYGLTGLASWPGLTYRSP